MPAIFSNLIAENIKDRPNCKIGGNRFQQDFSYSIAQNIKVKKGANL